MSDLSVSIGKLMLKNPIMPASGTFGAELTPLLDINRLGALVPKSVTVSARDGNPSPRVCETSASMINSIGIQSKGIDDYVTRLLPEYRKFSPPLIASISGETIQEYETLAARLDAQPDVAALELNISCPNLRTNGQAFGMSAEATAQLVRTVRAVTDKTVIVKLTPNVTRIQDIAQAAEHAGADALTVANTFLAMAIDSETRKPRIGNLMGGLSGAAVKPLVVRLIYQVHQATRLPIIGSGGVMNGQDAIEMILAGASAVQVGTATFLQPNAMTTIIDDIDDYLNRHQIEHLTDLIGQVDLS
ncbi:dihydroorotate dehydrogenase [Sporolactobacillus inulinus]|uniref:Dihydroorotate dehydrogenase n=1 Tax=Sporolactobacillus inulinus CASD TaxID=1069536 RepID=A0A0U1QT51_9BACL|nr:dihydroorotate dehydrogenase [Sporolactobacillus inulinus]KLI03896.1 dihydroorotate dehydrogenase [Sporolactobacillus inulinus CASD]GEB77503.1 dihydroorotate dehydrogenase B (NAD(+)), catalytic subunit [Sporolactobacillus inulinus]